VKNIHKRGFLLFELLCVFALLTVVCTFALSQLRFLSRGYVRTELETLYQTCLYAQRYAMSSGSPCVVVLDIAKNQYMCNGRVHRFASGVSFGTSSARVKGPPSSPSQEITVPSTFNNNRIVCFPEGIIEAGTIYMTDSDGRSLYALTSGVAPYSYLRKYRYAGTWQRLE
jgi:type II secretory pathway pseudopilin PulG